MLFLLLVIDTTGFIPIIRERLLIAEVLRDALVCGLGVRLLLQVAVLNAPNGIFVRSQCHGIPHVVLERNHRGRGPFLGPVGGHLEGKAVLFFLQSAVAHLVEEVRSVILNVSQLELVRFHVKSEELRLSLVPLLVKHDNLAPFLTQLSVEPEHLVFVVINVLFKAAITVSFTVEHERGTSMVRLGQLQVEAV